MFARFYAWLRSGGRWLSEGDDARVARRGERLAERTYRQQGYRVLARNLRSRAGEIDLLLSSSDGRTVVVAEVKTSRELSAYRPEWRVGPAKRRKLAALAVQAARRHRLEGRRIRFDVVGVTLEAGDEPIVRHYPGAFESPY